MEEKKVNSDIIRVIVEKYLPGTEKDNDEIIEIDNFIDLWEDDKRPVLSEIEDVLEYLGFKEEKCRIEFGFYVKEPRDVEGAMEVK